MSRSDFKQRKGSRARLDKTLLDLINGYGINPQSQFIQILNPNINLSPIIKIKELDVKERTIVQLLIFFTEKCDRPR